MLEYMDIYDANRNKTGKIIERKNKKKVSEGEYTISVHCFIINSKKQILLTQRSFNKKRGGKWEETHGGLKAGENSIDGIIRELQEEIGVDVKSSELKLYSTIKNKKVFRDIYILYKDVPKQSIKFVDGEVIDCKYVTVSDYKKMIKMGKCTSRNFNETIFIDKGVLNNTKV